MEDYHRASLDSDGDLMFRSPIHKTSATHGPARLIICSPNVAIMRGWAEVVRPTLPNIANQELLIINSQGMAVKNYRHFLDLMKARFNLP